MTRTTIKLTCSDCAEMHGDDEMAVYGGSIEGPGKFEGESPYALHFYHQMMDGTLESCACGADYGVIDEFDAQHFPELRDSIGGFAHISVSDSGFVYCEIVSLGELEEHEASIEDDSDD